MSLMELEEEEDGLMAELAGDDSTLVVVPGEEVTRGSGFLRGHGTYVERLADEDDEEGQEMLEEGEDEDARNKMRLVASVAGAVLRVNKLISVTPVQNRYSGNIGDVVIGRVLDVGNKRWGVDLAARQNGVLMLGSINLPGGALRRRTLEDQLQMRTLYKENDLLSAEVSNFFQDGGMAIHARSMRYGKLENGVLVSVNPSLVKRMNQHFVTLPCGVEAIFGLNGRIWLTTPVSKEEDDLNMNDDPAQGDVERSRMTEQMETEKKRHAKHTINEQNRLKIARVRNSILYLSSKNRRITPQSVMEIYEASIRNGMSPKAILSPDIENKIK